MTLRNPFRKIVDNTRPVVNNKIAISSVFKLTLLQIKANWLGAIADSKRFFNNRIVGLFYYLIGAPVKVIISNFAFVFFSKENDYDNFLGTNLNLFNPEFYPIKKVW